MASNAYKLVESEWTTLSAIESFYSDIAELAEEAREIVDNAPESLQSSPRIETLSETADTLERIEQRDPPDTAAEQKFKVKLYVPKRKSDRISRAVRLENAAILADQACGMIGSWCDAQADELEDGADDPTEEWRLFIEEVREDIEQAESVEFPGMMG